MKAIILAGGPGTRLLPYTKHVPKCLLKVGGKSILSHQLDVLKDTGVTEIAIVTGYLGEKIIEHLKGRDDLKLTIIENKEYGSSNSAYGLYLAKDFALEDQDGFLVINADLIFTSNMLKILLSSPHKDAMIIRREIGENDMCNVKMQGERIMELSKEVPKKEAQAEAVGPILFSHNGGKKFLERLADERNNWVFYVLSEFAKENSFFGVEDQGHPWAEIDTPNDIEEAKKIFG